VKRIAFGLLWVALTMVGGTADGFGAADGGRCWRGRPLPECRSFWITEFGIGWRLTDSSDPARARELFDHYAVYDFGWMVNRTSKTAWGATFSLKGMGETHVGVHIRLRRWIDRNWALDVSPGILLAGRSHDDDYDLEYPTLSGRLRISYGDWFGLTGGAELARIRDGATEVDGFAGVELGAYGGTGVGLMFTVLSLLYVSSFGGGS